MALTYAQYQVLMSELLVIPDYLTNANWAVILPQMIEYAENRIYRELDLITTQSSASVNTVAGTRTVTLPGSILILQSANCITPASTAANAGTRNPLRRASIEFINATWPSAATTGTPAWYSMTDFTTVLLAPTPSAIFAIECYGIIRPSALSASTTTTWISTYIPDVLVAASMIFGLGWQRDFGQIGGGADDPEASVFWSTQYETLKTSAMVDDARRKAQSVDWQALSPTPVAQPPR